MPVICDWYDKSQAIIITSFVGEWTLEELAESDKVYHQLAQSVEGRFDTIANLSRAAYTPPSGILSFWVLQTEGREAMFPNWGITVHVTDSQVLATYFNEGRRQSDIISKHYRHCKTLNAALMLIAETRELALF